MIASRYVYLWNRGGPDDVRAIANMWAEYLRQAWTRGLSADCVATGIAVSRMADGETKAADNPVAVGQVSGARAALTDAAVMHWDTEVDSPAWQQRWYRRPLPAAHVSGGLLNDDGVNAWNKCAAITVGLFLNFLPESYMALAIVRDGAYLPGEPDPGVDYFLPVSYIRMARWVVRANPSGF